MHKSVDRVTGMRKFKGNIDGKDYDSCKVYIETKFNDAGGNRRGTCTMEYSCGTSDVFDRWKNIPLPNDFEIEWETMTNGKESQQVIMDIKPTNINAAKPVKAV